MPTIAIFYGIIIMMHPKGKEHNPPHIHAKYGDSSASFDVKTGEIIIGFDFPRRASQMVKEFIELNRNELLKMWENQQFIKLKGLD